MGWATVQKSILCSIYFVYIAQTHSISLSNAIQCRHWVGQRRHANYSWEIFCKAALCTLALNLAWCNCFLCALWNLLKCWLVFQHEFAKMNPFFYYGALFFHWPTEHLFIYWKVKFLIWWSSLVCTPADTSPVTYFIRARTNPALWHHAWHHGSPTPPSTDCPLWSIWPVCHPTQWLISPDLTVGLLGWPEAVNKLRFLLMSFISSLPEVTQE